MPSFRAHPGRARALGSLLSGCLASLTAAAACTPAAQQPREYAPCERPACAGDEAASLLAGGEAPFRRQYHRPPPPPPPPLPQPSAAAASPLPDDASLGGAYAPLPCPCKREELGWHTWHFVHSLAAYYPEEPSQEERAAALGLVEALRLLYPCDHCRAAFASGLEEDPPDASSGRALAAWAWRQHNAVNAALGKPAFPLEALQARWRSGCRDARSGQQRLQ